MADSKPNALELAKQGNPQAIAVLINRQLQSKGITSKASRKDGLLQILLEASDTPDQKAFSSFLEKGIKQINPQDIKAVKIYGKSQSNDVPDWSYLFELALEKDLFDTSTFQDGNDNKKMPSHFEAEGKNGKIRLTQKRVIISREGFWGFVSQGMAGDKEIPIRNITAVQFKPAGNTLVGYLQFTVLGGVEKQGGVFKAVDDENTVAFFKHQQPNFEEIKKYVDSILDEEPIEIKDLRYTDPETVEVEKPFWDKPLEIGQKNNRQDTQEANTGNRHPKGSASSSNGNKNRLTIGLCGILLGFIGVHKFILGYNLEGFILLGVTVLSLGTLSGITFLIGLIEGIIYLLKSDKEFQKTYVQNKKGWF